MTSTAIHAAETKPAAPRTGLSKSRFLVGSQCHRLLWWKTYEPEAPALEAADNGAEMIFAQGHLVGEEARRRFPNGVLVDLPHSDVEGRVARTKELIAARAPVIFEASFIFEGVFVAVDILVRNNEGWDLIEVKCTTRVKDEHLLDVALQLRVSDPREHLDRPSVNANSDAA